MILPETHHDGPGPVDSRGLSMGATTAVLEHPPATGLIQIAGKYLAAPGAPTAPCHMCGKPQPVAMTLARPLLERPYAICPSREQDECMNRGLANLAAKRAKEQAAEAAKAKAEAEDAAAVAEEAAGKRPRPSQARKAVLAEASKTAAEGAADDNAPAPPAEENPGGDAA